MADVFISYSRTTQKVVRRLAEAIEREGYSVWWDDDLPPHRTYRDVISETIKSAKAAIVVWSNTAIESEWVHAEADLARTQKKLIQTSIDDCMPPMPFNQIQVAFIGDWKGEADHPGWSKVRASLRALCGPPRAEEPSQGAPAFPAVAPIPSPKPRPALPPAPAARGRSSPVLALIAVSLLVIATVGVLALVRTGSPGPAVDDDRYASATAPTRTEAAPAASAVTEPPVADQFTREAMTRDTRHPAELRTGPAASAPAIASIQPAEIFNTYPQSGDWWRLRKSNGLVGYLESSNVRMIDSRGASSPAAPRGNAANSPPAARLGTANAQRRRDRPRPARTATVDPARCPEDYGSETYNGSTIAGCE